ncbi:acetyl-CoA carboxylase subunit alpha [Carbonactinospora thermoautotrophica]|uniref:Acetyl-CoA carboxylase subunit alpha n=2 Tax=Carbonactinospora thermoautotrophica TaxID=1469144 RepID=A0A132MZ06_9ACTN|nr:biotin carboxylase N-terminal domain-containing protein [Carbonactinospora thermoautotrophica]KWX02582.1 Methylcrotonyl-CoA carboxylase biotin-containing subunit [Carbonactinospora thermoautotrophica]KWX03665.1 acetyl-CoA carboxylase subunit alpha [Carbonactinospora thermoautotrophica]
MIDRLLVANRGEIARRVFRTCRDLGITTVAVYSDADADAPHAREADLAVRLPGNPPGETYLRADLLIRAAHEAGADAVHPGYGFLSENAAFAREVLDAGLVWVGPPPAAIEAMGSKIAAKELMRAAGVPVLDALDPAQVSEADLPVLVKASAGGGGRGMRIVRSLAELPAQLEAARAEAASAFGDPTVFCEPYLEGRHIEVQVLADRHGTVWALGERECSIQRRHQKVVEEAPSPMVDAGMRARLCEAATRAARAVGYVGAGTVEFLAAPDGRFFFLEMNTRLQVEHPVTECVTGLDLVRWQIRIAEGARLPETPPGFDGHAIEVRLYAEDPAEGWRPQSGTLHRFAVPGVDAEFRVPGSYGLRLDSGVADGSVVSVHYDPLLAKVIAWAPTREEAARRLATALSRARIHGLGTNRDLLVRVLRHPAFLAGETDTGFFDRHGLDVLAAPLADKRAESLAALAAALADAAANRAGARVLASIPSGWRNLPSQPQRKAYQAPSGRIEVAYRLGRDGLAAEGYDEIALVSGAPDRVVLDVAGVRHAFAVAAYDGLVCVDSPLGAVTLRPVPRFPDPEAKVEAGSLLAPTPGAVIRVDVAEGDRVAAGQTLLVLEAMKMQHPIAAPEAGVVRALRVTAGQQVEAGAVLAVVTPQEEP